MDVTPLTEVLEPCAPATTVVVDLTAAEERAPDEVRLRWQDLRGRLAADGAPAEDLAAVDEVVTAPPGVGGAVSRYVAARGGRVLLEEVLVEGQRDGVGSGTVAPIVDLVPLLRYEQRHAPVVVVRADREGADAEVVTAAGAPPVETASTQGSTLHIRKVKVGDWAHPQFQRRSENLWQGDAEQAGAEVARLYREHAASAVVLSGDVRARQLVAEQLRELLPPGAPVVQVEGDRRADGASQVPVDLAVARGLDERAARTEDEAVQRWRAVHDDESTRDRSTADLFSTVDAVRAGQVEELLLVPAALTGAQVQLVELEQAVLPDGVGARLRWSSERPPGTA
ncbi:Vms1/Ankzf1 family peptidyl-tRNA hydrolase [Quadrisphaera sp. DSM 44207]|uniref:baeRF2 domain-containing protein n=1 Tax=Quadrisphaera sp. DSM 44207 TaxID=1881057 RepID=UPI0008872BD4|nr:Vms1/Ankzf1 family peptidyl-tRNA hydrolase [Quadrisphaera sp. DSM 44207]SDQ18681.1 hypothetical protein SAMN05428996_0988 [Quadrisphaera sp. DSM 44207]